MFNAVKALFAILGVGALLVFVFGFQFQPPDCNGDRNHFNSSHVAYCHFKKMEEGSTPYKTCQNGTPVLKLKDGRLWQHGEGGYSGIIFGCPEDLIAKGIDPKVNDRCDSDGCPDLKEAQLEIAKGLPAPQKMRAMPLSF